MLTHVIGAAFDRVHRIGQIRPVTVERLVVANTVEDRVLDLQLRKKNLADGSLGEGNGQKIGRALCFFPLFRLSRLRFDIVCSTVGLTVRELANCEYAGTTLGEKN
jgi:hypothetical protein